MKGATYVTVEADAAFVMPMNASGGEVSEMVTVTWTTDGGITGHGWEYNGDQILDSDPENMSSDEIDGQIKSFLGTLGNEIWFAFQTWSGCARMKW